MNANSQSSEDKEKLKARIKKLVALSKSPFKAEADVARRKAQQLLKVYHEGKKNVLHPPLNDYTALIYRAFVEGFGGVWGERYSYGDEKTLGCCAKFVNKCVSEITYASRECEKNLTNSNKNTIGVMFWYQKGFYDGLCEGLNVMPQHVNIVGVSHLDYGSQLYVFNNARAHGLGIGRYYASHRDC